MWNRVIITRKKNNSRQWRRQRYRAKCMTGPRVLQYTRWIWRQYRWDGDGDDRRARANGNAVRMCFSPWECTFVVFVVFSLCFFLVFFSVGRHSPSLIKSRMTPERHLVLIRATNAAATAKSSPLPWYERVCTTPPETPARWVVVRGRGEWLVVRERRNASRSHSASKRI